MNDFSDIVNRIVNDYGYLAIFVALVLENTLFLGLLIPGVTILVIAGFVSAIGGLDVSYCLAVGIAGTIIGDNISYLAGRYGAERLRFIDRILNRNKGILSRIKSLNNYVLIFFHFPGFLRLALPVALGVSKFDVRKWIVIDLIGSVLFNFAFIGLGYLIGSTSGAFADASSLAGYLQYVFAGFFLIWFVMLFRGYLSFRKRSGTPPTHLLKTISPKEDLGLS